MGSEAFLFDCAVRISDFIIEESVGAVMRAFGAFDLRANTQIGAMAFATLRKSSEGAPSLWPAQLL